MPRRIESCNARPLGRARHPSLPESYKSELYVREPKRDQPEIQKGPHRQDGLLRFSKPADKPGNRPEPSSQGNK
jgi:hypothetical protein